MRLTLAVQDYPFSLKDHGGPEVFMRRLTDSFIEHDYAKISSVNNPFYDIALFSVHLYGAKSYLTRLLKKPYVLRIDGIYFDKKNTVGDTQKLNSMIFRSIDNASGIVFISHFSKKMVEKFHKRINTLNTVVHNAVSIDKFSPYGPNLRSKLGLRNSEVVIVVSGHWRRHKRLRETVEFFNHLRHLNKNTYKLIVLGSGADADLNDENIIYAEEIDPDSLALWYRTADIYLHPAWIEPCGNTQIEAMACGIPVLCTNNGGIGETVVNANGGIVSKCDEQYKMEMLDYYNPPKPDYNVLIKDFNTLCENRSNISSSIKFRYLDIKYAANQYYKLIRKAIDNRV